MIRYTSGNILDADVEALVNPINCTGVIGRAISGRFAQAYPANVAAYAQACKECLIEPGQMFIFETRSSQNPKYIINFPTKGHWQANTRLNDIASGICALVAEVKLLAIRSIAIPPLGVGVGSVVWPDVRKLVDKDFEGLTSVEAVIFEPTDEGQAA